MGPGLDNKPFMNNIFSLSLYFGRQNTENPEEEGDPQRPKERRALNHHPMTIMPMTITRLSETQTRWRCK